MAKINFLANIEDEVYEITKKTLSMDDSRTYAQNLCEIWRKGIEVEAMREQLRQFRRSNHARSRNSTNTPTIQQSQTNK